MGWMCVPLTPLEETMVECMSGEGVDACMYVLGVLVGEKERGRASLPNSFIQLSRWNAA